MSPPAPLDILRMHVFRDSLGWWGIGIGAGGRVAAVALPGGSRARAEAVLRRRARVLGLRAVEGGRPPAAVARAIRAWQGGAPRGKPSGRGPALDLRGVSPFDRRVLEAVRRIRFGQTRTYGEIAASIGKPGAARAVGAALGRNPVPLFVPCHRVVRADGALGGFSAAGGVSLKRRMLAHESRPAATGRRA